MKKPLEYGDRVRFTDSIRRVLAPNPVGGAHWKQKGTVVGFHYKPVAGRETPAVVEILWDDGERTKVIETNLVRVK